MTYVSSVQMAFYVTIGKIVFIQISFYRKNNFSTNTNNKVVLCNDIPSASTAVNAQTLTYLCVVSGEEIVNGYAVVIDNSICASAAKSSVPGYANLIMGFYIAE